MQLLGKPIANLQADARDFINLFSLLGERAENFLPRHIYDNLKNFVRLCCEEPDDPCRQKVEIDKAILELKELIPGYTSVSLMLFPHEDSKAFQYTAKRLQFTQKLTSLIDNELVDEKTKEQSANILRTHDYSIGTPPVTQEQINLMYKLVLGDDVGELRKYRDVIGVNGDIEETQWNYFMDVLEQMIIQSTHYTTNPEKTDFLLRTELTVNFKGLNGFIRTVVGGNANTVIELVSCEIFNPQDVKVIEFEEASSLFEQIKNDMTSIFVIKAKNMRKNIFNNIRWFPYLTRLVIVDDSPESRSTNTSLVFAFHNKIINTLNKVHTKKLGALANTQLNLRLILDKVNDENLEKFRSSAKRKIADYEEELNEFKKEQLGDTNNLKKDITLFKFNDFARQIIKDKYAVTKLHDYIVLIQDCKDPQRLQKTNKELIHEFESRTKAYIYSNIEQVHIATIVEGGGRGQLRTYGEYLLQRPLKPIDNKIVQKCKTIIDIIPNNYQRTLRNHFHKNFGINLFLEKYKAYITKVENESNNKGRFTNFLIDIGINEEYQQKTPEEQKVIKDLVGSLSNMDLTTIADDVQMIIRDILFHSIIKPYILFNSDASWEYKDLFPVDRFDINPFDLEVGLTEDKRIDFERLHHRLNRMKGTFQLFDETGHLWDRFCENLTIIINDPSNPSGYTDFNNPALIKFLKFLNNNKITLLLDEAYSDAIKIDDPEEPKWRTISRYVMNNISSLPNISIVSSLSTTKNLGATGNRLGSLIATPARKDVIAYAKKQNSIEKGNTNSLYMLVNTIEAAQLSKKIKDSMEQELPKDASRYKIKSLIEKYIIDEIESYAERKSNTNSKSGAIKRFSPFEGSPLHTVLLDELVSLDKLDVLGLPDDFKYKGQPFYVYYQDHFVKELNNFRVNKLFRRECNRRLTLIKEKAREVIKRENAESYCQVLDSDGSYLFNLLLLDFFSFQDLEKFAKKLAEQRGVSVLPYQTGFLRFSLGDFLDGSDQSYEIFAKEFDNSLTIVLKYWKLFYDAKSNTNNKEKRSGVILNEIFKSSSDMEFVDKVLHDYDIIKNLKKSLKNSLTISNIMTLYHAFPKDSGVTINTIRGSQNSVFEFYENIGGCTDLKSFISSKAFTKIYENLLPQIYKNIPLIKHLDVNSVISKYGKATILKYISNKIDFQPNGYVLDDADEKIIMKEILIELEKILFSDSKVKILALNASNDPAGDKAKLEGINRILKKYIEELLLHFNLPFGMVGKEPTIKELVEVSVEQFEELVGKSVNEFNLVNYLNEYVSSVYSSCIPKTFGLRFEGNLRKNIQEFVIEEAKDIIDKLVRLYLLKRNDQYKSQLKLKLDLLGDKLDEKNDTETQLVLDNFIQTILNEQLSEITRSILKNEENKITQDNLYDEARDVSLFFIKLINKTKSTEYYDRYNHSLIKLVDSKFRCQNSSINEMIQHGITLHKDFEKTTTGDATLDWINKVMTKCGVIGLEQTVQTHTRIATDSKKRVYPNHKADRLEIQLEERDYSEPHEYIKSMDIKPQSAFFGRRMEKFIENMDENDYRCKIIQHGLVKVLYVFQKSYLKYLTDNYRLIQADEVTLEDVKKFTPDIILFYGAPEKVISFPQIGYFDLRGPNGNIKTLVTPLKKEVDYFGNIKKPWLNMLNEKVKEMGGIPIHGSLFAVEEEDGSIFVVQVDGDSGVGKSEMLAAMMLKWLKKDLPGIRSIKMIAGDMFFIFSDKNGELYGVGTEEGDFSRVTDFDPDFIKYYYSLFAKAADSNVDDLNSRSTISGLCDITMPFKIDIMLTASNFARAEAGITRYENPENFLFYRDSHGERMEKATSADNPHLQRTLLRYSGDKNIVDVMDKHGNYIDDVLNWEKDERTNKLYLCASYKMIDKIDIEDLVNKIFVGKMFKRNKDSFKIIKVNFDIIKNKFIATTLTSVTDTEDPTKLLETKGEVFIDREIFSGIYNALASTPAGQPFVAEEGQLESRKHLVNILKGGKEGSGKGKHIRLGILSTDLGRKGKEITGPQAAAEDMKIMIQEVRIFRNDINMNKNLVSKLVYEKYHHIFEGYKYNSEVCRYNFVLFQMEQMKKAKFVRIDDLKTKVDLSGIKGFQQVETNKQFSPLLITPNINIELNSFSETYEQLMSLPNNPECADDFYEDADKLYVAEGYGTETIVNNMVLQLLIMSGYLMIEDITRGRITEKVNRETLAAAKFTAFKKLNELKK
jgi:hypothetical protein